jgi:hypothetical protein
MHLWKKKKKRKKEYRGRYVLTICTRPFYKNIYQK